MRSRILALNQEFVNRNCSEKAESFKEKRNTVYYDWRSGAHSIGFVYGKVEEILTATWNFVFLSDIPFTSFVIPKRSDLSSFRFQLLTDAGIITLQTKDIN